MLPEEVTDWILAAETRQIMQERLAYCIPVDDAEAMQAVAKATGIPDVDLRKLARGIGAWDSLDVMDRLLRWAAPGYAMLPRAKGANADIGIPDRVQIFLGKIGRTKRPVVNIVVRDRVLETCKRGERKKLDPEAPRDMTFEHNGRTFVCKVDHFHNVIKGTVRELRDHKKPAPKPERKPGDMVPSWERPKPPDASPAT